MNYYSTFSPKSLVKFMNSFFKALGTIKLFFCVLCMRSNIFEFLSRAVLFFANDRHREFFLFSASSCYKISLYFPKSQNHAVNQPKLRPFEFLLKFHKKWFFSVHISKLNKYPILSFFDIWFWFFHDTAGQPKWHPSEFFVALHLWLLLFFGLF